MPKAGRVGAVISSIISTLIAIFEKSPPRRSPMARIDLESELDRLGPRKGEGEGAVRLWTG